MNIALLCALIIVTGQADCCHVENTRTPHNKETERGILLRKLQTFQHDDPKETATKETATWNQILADALVNRIKIFSYKDTENTSGTTTKNNLLTNCISQMMHLYKTLIYDKLHKRIDTTDDSKATKANDNGSKGAVETEKVLPDPKDEVEIVEPKYHGKLCVDCELKTVAENGVTETLDVSEKVETVTGCPDGLVADEAGCTNPKSNFILSIPYQCPTGYRRDWFGYCRPPL